MFRVIPEGAAFREHVLLRNGRGVLLRAATPADAPAVEALIARVSPESRRLRFGAAVRGVPRDVVEGLTCGDFTERGCLLAVIREGGEERVIGTGNYLGLGDGRSAEIAILVDDDYRGLGVSTLLLERLAGLAAANDYVEFVAEVMEENRVMLDVLEGVGFEVHQVHEGGMVHVEIPVGGAAAIRERAQLRERIAVARSLAPLLRPRSVAVVGVSRSRASVGRMIFHRLLADGFTGAAYPVHPEGVTVEGVASIPALDAAPEAVDLVVIAVPAAHVPEAARRAAEAGARGLVVVSTGFAEAGPEGAELQRRLVDVVRGHGLRLIGPCSLGVINTDPAVSLNASLAETLPRRGGLGFFSHSAALGLAVLEDATARGVGFSTFVAAGNRADVQAADLLLYWEEDPRTEMVALYLESFGDPRSFARAARRLAPRKPILCVKSARSGAGRMAASAHCGAPAAAGLDADVLFRQAGIIRVDTLSELFDAAVLLESQPLPSGDRIAVVTNSGGLATLCADACAAQGLDLPAAGIIRVPVLAAADAVRDAIRRAFTEGGADMVLAAFAAVGRWTPGRVRRAVAAGIQAAGAAAAPRTAALCLVGATGRTRMPAGEGGAGRLPVYRFPEAAVRALGHAARYARFRRRPPGRVRWHADADPAAAGHLVHGLLAAAGGAAVVEPAREEAAALLAAFGIRVRPEAGTGAGVAVTTDPLFGPVIELRDPGGRALAVGITPLTDRDVGEMAAAAGEGGAGGLAELLSRLSQLVEELPWVWCLEARAAAGDRPALAGPVRLALRRPAVPGTCGTLLAMTRRGGEREKG